MMPFNPNDLIAILPELILLGATCAILLIDLFLKPSQRDFTHWMSIASAGGFRLLRLAAVHLQPGRARAHSTACSCTTASVSSSSSSSC